MLLTLAAVLAWPAAAAPPWLGTGRVHGFVVETQGRPVLGAADAVATIEEFGAQARPAPALATPLRRLLEERQGAKLIFCRPGRSRQARCRRDRGGVCAGPILEFHDAAFARDGSFARRRPRRVARRAGWRGFAGL